MAVNNINYHTANVNQTTPAIVAQSAVNRLPRIALLMLCVAYVLPGLLGRGPWKGADISSFGYMAALARGETAWFAPQLLGLPPAVDALFPYWWGAWAMVWAPAWIAPDLAVRIAFGLLLALTLVAVWYGTYYLARSPEAQPVAFAFGGEALPADYARAMADGGLLAFIACLGLAQLSHETTPAMAQLTFTALFAYALAALPYRTWAPAIAGIVGLTGLAVSGAPTMAILFGAGSALIYLLDQSPEPIEAKRQLAWVGAIVALTVGVAVLSSTLNLWRWRIDLPQASWLEWRNLGRLQLWFTWPAWPLVLWTLWRWRRHLVRGQAPTRHLALPLWMAIVALGATFTTDSADRSLLLALPALAALAAFALPTLGRSVSALIDWFTLIFFSGCAIVIWVVWISMQTGIPRQPAANVARLAPGFEHSFSLTPFLIAVMATVAWSLLVKWRVGRHRSAIWKSLVLPAGGAVLSWLLLMTLWLPLLDFARSYAPFVQRAVAVMQPADCVETLGLNRGQISALQFHGRLVIKTASAAATCNWLMVGKDIDLTASNMLEPNQWLLVTPLRKASRGSEEVKIYRRSDKSASDWQETPK